MATAALRAACWEWQRLLYDMPLAGNGNPTGCWEKASAFSCLACDSRSRCWLEKASAFSCLACDSHGLASIARYDWRCRWQNRATATLCVAHALLAGNCSPTGCLEKASAFSCSVCDSHV